MPLPFANDADQAAPTKSVVPTAVTLRIVWQFTSDTKRTPVSGFIATLRGLEKDADALAPFAQPIVDVPANVDVTPAGVMRLILPFPLSATKTSPLESTATPAGRLKVAAVPSVEPDAPVPASVVTFQ